MARGMAGWSYDYDQLAASFMSMVHIATARYWLKFVYAA